MKLQTRKKSLTLIIGLIVLLYSLTITAQTPQTREETRQQAIEAFSYGFALLETGKSEESNHAALVKLLEAYKLFQTIGDKNNEVLTLIALARVSDNLGEKAEAIRYLEKARSLVQSFNPRDKFKESVVLNNLGTIYHSLGENQIALKQFEETIELMKEAKDNNFQLAGVHNNIGIIYKELGDNIKALESYEKSLRLYKSIEAEGNDAVNFAVNFIKQKNIAAILHNLGEIYFPTDKQKALDYFKQAILVFFEIKDRSGIAMSTSSIAFIYLESGDKQRAIQLLNIALIFQKNAGNLEREADTLANLMFAWQKMGNSRFAIFYGKQAVGVYQDLRSKIRTLDNQLQKSYVKDIEKTYRTLVEILIAENRLAEAQQIINSFKDQQAFDVKSFQSKETNSLNYTKREDNFISQCKRINEKIISITKDLNTNVSNGQPTSKEIENKLNAATNEYLTVLKQAETEYSEPKDEKDKISEIPIDLLNMQATLRELSANTKQKAVTVYQLVGEENFSVLVITADDIKSVSTPFKNSDLNQKALDFWALLQSPVYDPNLVGKELYDVVFKPLESVLPKDTKTILWSLDGNLRYVPMAALFDGKQYLAEKYNHVNFTRADKERMTRTVKPVWTATGLGTSEEKTVELLGSRISFDALPGVGEEFKLLFKPKTGSGGIFSGKTFQNVAFNKKTMLEALKQKRPLVHIASHFSFRAGDEARSFLLLGDGTAFTLEEMKREPNLFEGVDLLTLSACNTAAQQSGANGREVDGFAELAQRLGANSVMATLWSVADCTTPWLMREFYNSKLNKNKNKAESLREAQISLISGKAEIKTCPTRTDLSQIKIVVVENETERKKQPTRSGVYYLDKKNAPLWDKEKHPPFAHPFYWSPFILFGNWK